LRLNFFFNFYFFSDFHIC